MAEKKIYRLNKVLREYNISLDRVIEFLNSKGYEIDARPTTKISQEIYKVIAEEFQIDRTKNEASKVVGEERRKEKESLRSEIGKSLREELIKIDDLQENENYKTTIEPSNEKDSEKLKKGKNEVNKISKLKERRNLKEIKESPKTGSRLLISNFRRSKGNWDIYLSPITFLTGTNNSGKSTILKSLMLIDDFGNSENHFEFNFNGKNSRNHKIDSYSNALNWSNQSDKNFRMHLSFENHGYEVSLEIDPLEFEESKIRKGKILHMTLKRNWDGAKIKLDRISIRSYQLVVDSAIVQKRFTKDDLISEGVQKGMQQLYEKLLQNAEEKRKALSENSSAIISLNQEIEKLKKNLSEIKRQKKEVKNEIEDFQYKPLINIEEEEKEGLRLDRVLRVSLTKYFRDNEKKIGLSDESENLSNLIFLSEKIEKVLNLNLVHLSPQRNSQTRLYINEKTSNDIYDLINLHSNNPILKGSEAYHFIIDWMDEFDIGTDYNIKDVEGLASIIEIEENWNWINLVDKGFGAGQIFAIIFRTALCINSLDFKGWNDAEDAVNPLVLIEEPEANLHPALQSKLAEFFEDAYWEFGIRFVVETHSEYILRKSQILMKEWKAEIEKSNFILEDQEEPFGVYYFDKNTGPFKMHYDEEGKFIEDFGEGFFDVSRKLTRKLL